MADRNIMLAAQESIKHEFRLTDAQVDRADALVARRESCELHAPPDPGSLRRLDTPRFLAR